MNQPLQDFSARTRFDTTLPEDARAEFFRPKRPRIFVAPSPPPKLARSAANQAIRWLLVLLFLVVLGMLVSWFAKAPTSHPLTTQPQSTPTSITTSPSANLAAPRAQLVSRPTQLIPTPVRRAILYRLPSQTLGVYKWYPLPAEWGGGTVWARYMGTKEHFSQIPRAPMQGDLWNVTEGNASWIYCTPAGYTHPIWIDP
jgi:hypothetical protein